MSERNIIQDASKPKDIKRWDAISMEQDAPLFLTA
jgi:hypothetical protein